MIMLVLGATAACSELVVVKPAPTPTAVPSPPPGGDVDMQFAGAGGQQGEPGLPTRLVAESIGLDAPVVRMDWQVESTSGQDVSVWNVPENEAGWHANSARPGEGSNVVISGHNNSTGGHVFGALNRLKTGDLVTLWAGGQAYMYRVSHRQIVRAFGASPETLAYLRQVIQPTAREQLTLITCWPNWTNTHRLVVIADPVSSPLP